MAVYFIALVRFDGGNRAYPVNADEFYQPGQRVVVEINRGQKSLAKAEIVGRSLSSKPCRHSIVCLEENAEDYGDGPSGVTSKAELDRFMRHMNLRPVPAFSCSHGGREVSQQDWSLAYLHKDQYPFRDDAVRPFLMWGDVYLLGPSGVGICYREDDCVSLWVVGQRLGVARTSRLPLSSVPKEVFQGIASLALGDLVHEKVPEQTDRRLSQIKNAVSGGGDSPHYLGDGEWI